MLVSRMLEQVGFQGTATVVSSLSDVWVSQLTPGARFTLCAQGTPGTQHFSWASHSCPGGAVSVQAVPKGMGLSLGCCLSSLSTSALCRDALKARVCSAECIPVQLMCSSSYWQQEPSLLVKWMEQLIHLSVVVSVCLPADRGRQTQHPWTGPYTWPPTGPIGAAGGWSPSCFQDVLSCPL